MSTRAENLLFSIVLMVVIPLLVTGLSVLFLDFDAWKAFIISECSIGLALNTIAMVANRDRARKAEQIKEDAKDDE